MRNTLQYVYSISVFFGVLISAYLMMNKESGRVPLRAVQSPNPMRMEASALDPNVNQLFQMETELSNLPRPKGRKPSDESVR